MRKVFAACHGISPRLSVAGTSVKGTIQFGYLGEGNGGGAYDCREPVVVQRIRSIAWLVVVWIAKIGRIANHDCRNSGLPEGAMIAPPKITDGWHQVLQ